MNLFRVVDGITYRMERTNGLIVIDYRRGESGEWVRHPAWFVDSGASYLLMVEHPDDPHWHVQLWMPAGQPA